MARPSYEWPATAELRRLLDGLLAEVPSGATRAAVAAALELLSRHELVPRELAPSPRRLRPAAAPKGAPS